jgi:hypothetical protein
MEFYRWEEDFKPVIQRESRSGPWHDYAIENFRERWDEILERDAKRLVWTGIVPMEGHTWWISPGISIVNRECYFICEKPYPEGFSVDARY